MLYANYDGPIQKTTRHPVGLYDVVTDTPQYEIRLREQEGRPNEFWYYDDAAGVIRNKANSRFVLGWDQRFEKAAIGSTAQLATTQTAKLLKVLVEEIKNEYRLR